MLIAARNALLSGGPSLPYDRAVAWLESDGSQHIKTGLAVKDVRKFAVRAQLTEMPGSSTVYICGGHQSRTRIQVACNRSYIFVVFSTNAMQSAGITTDTSVHDIEFDSGKWYIDSQLKYTHTWAIQNTTSLFCLFAEGSGIAGTVASGMKGRIYSCQIYGVDDSLPLLRDFIPVCIGQVGYLYDRANPTGGPLGNGLYPNDGSGAFALGPDA